MSFDNMRELLNLGWEPIPIRVYLSKDGDKRFKNPLVKWKEIKGNITTELIDSWEESINYPHAVGLAVLAGSQRCGTNVVVVDLDPPEDSNLNSLTIPEELLAACASTMSTITPSGGRHYYFKYSGDYELRNRTNIFKKNKKTETVIDLRADGGISVIGDSRLWKWAWREKTQKNPTHKGEKKQTVFTKTHPIEVVPDRMYTTQEYLAPCDLAPLPDIIIKQYFEVASPDNPRDVKRIWSLVESKTLPDPEKGETAHDTLLSWSMKLLSTYFPTLSTDEEAKNLYKRFRSDVDFIVQDRKKKGGRQLDEEYLERIFFSAIKKLKKKRTSAYRMASGFLDPILKNNLIKAQRGRWAELKVTKILDFSSHLYAANKDESKGFELSPLSILRQHEWRSKHLIAFGSPALPDIPKAVFEQIVSEIPIRSMEHTNSSIQNVIHTVIQAWVDLAATSEDEVTERESLTQAKNIGRGGYTQEDKVILFLKLNAIQNELKSEGYGLIAPTKLAQVLTNLNISPVPKTSFWKITKDL